MFFHVFKLLKYKLNGNNFIKFIDFLFNIVIIEKLIEFYYIKKLMILINFYYFCCIFEGIIN